LTNAVVTDLTVDGGISAGDVITEHKLTGDCGHRPHSALNSQAGWRDGETFVVQIPLRLPEGPKLKIALDSRALTPPRSRVDSAVVKALARAHRWRRMLESGVHFTITELADAEKINQSYVCRVLRLTLLAPDIVHKILDGQQPSGPQLPVLLKPLPMDWRDQRKPAGGNGLISGGRRFVTRGRKSNLSRGTTFTRARPEPR
jgi:hypothetical protein